MVIPPANSILLPAVPALKPILASDNCPNGTNCAFTTDLAVHGDITTGGGKVVGGTVVPEFCLLQPVKARIANELFQNMSSNDFISSKWF